FVSYTGYGRVATLGEEVHDPPRTIPRAIIVTMAVVTVLYLSVAMAGVGVLGAEGFGAAAERPAAPLAAVALALSRPWLAALVAVSATAARAGVQLDRIVGVSRGRLAMGRRGDAPSFLGRVDEARGSPVLAVWCGGLLVALIAIVGDV